MGHRRRLQHVAGVSLASVLISVVMLLITPAQRALAHGGMVFPATRTYACYKQRA